MQGFVKSYGKKYIEKFRYIIDGRIRLHPLVWYRDVTLDAIFDYHIKKKRVWYFISMVAWKKVHYFVVLCSTLAVKFHCQFH